MCLRRSSTVNTSLTCAQAVRLEPALHTREARGSIAGPVAVVGAAEAVSVPAFCPLAQPIGRMCLMIHSAMSAMS